MIHPVKRIQLILSLRTHEHELREAARKAFQDEKQTQGYDLLHDAALIKEKIKILHSELLDQEGDVDEEGEGETKQ